MVKPHSQFKYKPHSFHYCYCNDFATLIYFAPFQLLVCGKYFGGKKKKKKRTQNPRDCPSLTGTVLACLECVKPQKSHFCSYYSLWNPLLKKTQHWRLQPLERAPSGLPFALKCDLSVKAQAGLGISLFCPLLWTPGPLCAQLRNRSSHFPLFFCPQVQGR